MSVERKILRCENGEHFYRGVQPFLNLAGNLLLGQIIRVYDYGKTADTEPHYVLGAEGKWYNAFTLEVADPKKFLSKKSAPEGWSFEGNGSHFLPDDEIRKIVEACDNKPKS